MSSIAENKAYQSVTKIASGLYNLPKSKKTVTTIQQAICITTDKASLKNSSDFLKFLYKLQDALPVKAGKEVDILLESFSEALAKINGMLQDIKGLFDNSEKDGSSIEIDDEHMIHFLANMQKSQEVLKYMVEYLEYYNQHKAISQEKKVSSTFDDLIAKINQAA